MADSLTSSAAGNSGQEGERLVCTACGALAKIAAVPSTCAVCDGILDVHLPEPGARPLRPVGGSDAGVWAWESWLPHCAPEARVSLGEGGSPLLRAPRLGERLGLDNLWIKNDSLQPTGSFKDRAVALATSLAKHYDRPGLVLSSSGNAGASSAAYAARAGLPLVVLVPETAPPAKLRQILVAGARLVTVRGETHHCCQLAHQMAAEMGWVNLTTTYHNPYGVDGYATIAYELVWELAGRLPEVLLMPISSGPLLGGVMKGFERLKAAGVIDRVPRPVAVQTEACAPIVRAFREGGAVTPWAHRKTVASALNDTLTGYERDGDYTLDWIRRYDGLAVAVGDADILAAQRLTAEREGVVLEPSGAVPVAALMAAREELGLSRDTRVVAVATGHGLKDLSAIEDTALPQAIAPQFEALAERMSEHEAGRVAGRVAGTPTERG